MPRLVPLALAVLVVPLALSGCIGPAEADAALGTPMEPTADEPPSPERLAWEGYLRAGAAYEVPGHIEETSAASRPLWSMSFQLHVEEAPEVMEVTLSWTAPVARLVLMVTEPFDREEPTWYESAPTDTSPVCFSIPADALRPGVWRIMAHSQVAVDAALSFEVAMTGGRAVVVDEPSHAPASEFPFIVARAETPAPPPCAAA